MSKPALDDERERSARLLLPDEKGRLGRLLDASLAPGEWSAADSPLSHKATRVQNGYVSSGTSGYARALRRS
jgi:hypothetical protein